MSQIRTIDELMEFLPQQIAELGYDRVLVSRIRGDTWLPLCGFARDDPAEADAMVTVAQDSARRLDESLLEFDVILRKAPIIVRDARNNRRVHRELVDLTSVQSYAAAPIMLRSTVVGFIHADRHRSSRALDPIDTAVLGVFGVAFGGAVEAIAVRRALQRVAAFATNRPTGLVDFPTEPNGYLTTNTGTQRGQHRSRLPEKQRREATLSARELQVLQHLKQGADNVTIAIKMGIAETTVKTHVKRVVRKMGAVNRIALVERPAGPTALARRLPAARGPGRR